MAGLELFKLPKFHCMNRRIGDRGANPIEDAAYRVGHHIDVMVRPRYSVRIKVATVCRKRNGTVCLAYYQKGEKQLSVSTGCWLEGLWPQSTADYSLRHIALARLDAPGEPINGA